MERYTCPHLGRPDDASTRMSFPSEGNFCHKAQPAAAPTNQHQAGFCLTGHHTDCPVYLMRKAQALPALIAAPAPPRELPWRDVDWERVRNTALVAAALLIYLLGGWFGGSQFAARVAALSITGPGADLGGSFFDNQSNPPAASGLLYDYPLPVSGGEAQECPLPEGWRTYIIQPTDSLFRLSIVYGVSVEALQQANCLGSSTYLRPGETLFVPAPKPTAFPSATLQPTQAPSATFTLTPPLVFNQNAANQPVSQPPSPTNTSVPPTLAPTNTNVPPTLAPAVAKPEPKPTKEEKPTQAPKPSSKDDDKDDDDKDDKKDNKGKGKGKGKDD